MNIEKVKEMYFASMYRYIKELKDNKCMDYSLGYASAEYHTTKEWLASLLSEDEMNKYEKECFTKISLTFDMLITSIKFISE